MHDSLCEQPPRSDLPDESAHDCVNHATNIFYTLIKSKRSAHRLKPLHVYSIHFTRIHHSPLPHLSRKDALEQTHSSTWGNLSSPPQQEPPKNRHVEIATVKRLHKRVDWVLLM